MLLVCVFAETDVVETTSPNAVDFDIPESSPKQAILMQDASTMDVAPPTTETETPEKTPAEDEMPVEESTEDSKAGLAEATAAIEFMQTKEGRKDTECRKLSQETINDIK